MPVVKPDFSETVAPLKVGSHKARIVQVDDKVSSKGNQYLSLKLETFGNDEDPKQNNKIFYHSVMVTGKGSFTLKDVLVALGMMQKTDMTFSEFATEDLVGGEVQVLLVPGKQPDGSPSDYPMVQKVEKIIN